MVEAARLGRSGCVLVRGEPGIGKSALVDDVVSRAGLRVLRTQGLESEAPLAYAALHRLMRPLLALVDALPPPQARALRIAFGEAEGARLEPFLVGLATLSLLTSAAEDEPLVCMVDDAHWLDAASADAMLFTARRLDADRLAICFVARHPDDTGFEPEGIPTLTLGALDEGSARALLLDSVGELPAEVSDRLLAETGGNPLALKELPTALSPAQRDGSEPLPATLPLTRSVERAFLERCRQLSEAAQTVLLVAVADGTGRLATLERAARALGIGTDAFDAVVRTGLLVVTGDNADVQHPLVRSAIYQAAGDRERRRVHEALAEVLGDLQDPDRQTWHLAAVADGPDPALAAALDDVAVRAESRGAHRAAADAHERAAELGEASAAAGRRFAAARSAWASGRARHASTLVAAARADVDDPLLRADLDRLRARIEVNTGSAHDAHRILTRAAERVAAHDPLRALEMAVAASVARSHGADSGAVLPAGTVDIRDAADDTARTRSLKHLLLSSEHAMVGERAGAVAELQVARSAGRTTEDLDLLGNLGNDALHLGEDEAHRELYALMLSVARERGDGMAVLYALQRSAFGLYLAGSWVELRSTCEEAVSLGRSVGQRASTATPLAWLTLVAALQGSPDHDGHRVALDELLTSHPAGASWLARWTTSCTGPRGSGPRSRVIGPVHSTICASSACRRCVGWRHMTGSTPRCGPATRAWLATGRWSSRSSPRGRRCPGRRRPRSSVGRWSPTPTAARTLTSCSDARWGTRRWPAGPTTARAPSSPMASCCDVADAEPMRASRCVRPSRRCRTCAPIRWRQGPPRSCGHRVRPRGAATSRPC